jgi:hypothetical protein
LGLLARNWGWFARNLFFRWCLLLLVMNHGFQIVFVGAAS